MTEWSLWQKEKTPNFSLLMPLCYTWIPFQLYYVYGIVMLSSKRALQISGTLVAGFEKSTFLRRLQVPFSTLHSLAVSLWPISSSSMIISCNLLNYFHRESYCESSAQVLFSLILVKNGDIRSRVGSRSSLYSFMCNIFLFLQKCSSGGQDEK